MIVLGLYKQFSFQQIASLTSMTKKMIEGKCIILMVYLNDQPLECCELTKKDRGNSLKIEQLRGKHNGETPRHSDCKKLVNQFIRNVGKNWQVTA